LHFQTIIIEMKQKRVLIGVLNWGLGHACRMIPIMRELSRRGWTIDIASDGAALIYLKKVFPNSRFYELPNLNIHYQHTGYLWFSLLRQLPVFTRSIKADREMLTKLLEEQSYDLILSDNRYGFYTSNVLSVLITHQLFPAIPNLLVPFRWLIDRWISKQIARFNQVWIPDYADMDISLTGILSHHHVSPKVRFIGPVTRLKLNPSRIEKDIDLLCILSGPEPQREMLEELLIKQLINTKERIIIIRGIPAEEQIIEPLNNLISKINFVLEDELKELMERSALILSRCAYTSVMDYVLNGCPAILIPTPGQWEQEYLAKHLASHPLFYITTQKKIKISLAMQALSLQRKSSKFYKSYFNQELPADLF